MEHVPHNRPGPAHHHGPPPNEWELREAIDAGASTSEIQALLDRGAQLEQTDALGRTPLHTAVICGHDEVVALLCRRGANVEARDVNDRTPLGYAAVGGKVGVGVARVGSDTALPHARACPPACALSQVHLAALLLNHGAHNEAHDGLHDALVQLAAEHGHASLEDLQRSHAAAT